MGRAKITVLSRGRALNLPRGEGLGVVHPDALLTDNGVYRIYYTPYPPDEAELPYLAESTDGVVFKPAGRSPLIERGEPGEWDSHHLADVDVVRVGSKWLMYYAGAKIENGVKKVGIGVAESSDGLKWEKIAGNPVLAPGRYWWEAGTKNHLEVSCPAALSVDGRVVMYYAALGRDGVYRIALAESQDGLSFEKVGVVLEPRMPWERRGVSHPDAVLYGDIILVLYVGDGELGRSLGLAWANADSPEKLERLQEPILRPRAYRLSSLVPYRIRVAARKLGVKACWDCWHVYRASLLHDPSGRLRAESRQAILYYSGYDALAGLPSIGAAPVQVDAGSSPGFPARA